MQHSLYLLRHAKSSWDDTYASDRDRVLNNRGRKDAPRMGAALARIIEPVAVCVSPARRAQLTLRGVCEGWPALGDMPHQTVEDLYTFSAAEVIVFIRNYEGADNRLFLIGHNPAFTDVVNYFCPDAYLDNLPTAGFAHIEFDVDGWSAVERGAAKLVTLLKPRELADERP